MRNQKIFSITTIAIGAAIVSVLSPFTIPIGVVPITLQTLAVALIATVFKPREAFFSILLYLVLGAIGLPVFAGGSSGGFASLFGPTGGYLLAFPIAGFLISFALQKTQHQPILSAVINILGQFLILIIGTLWLKYTAGINWVGAISSGFTPFVLVGTIKAVLATVLGLAILRALSYSNKYFAK